MIRGYLKYLALVLALDLVAAFPLTCVVQAGLEAADVPGHLSFWENYVFALAWLGVCSLDWGLRRYAR